MKKKIYIYKSITEVSLDEIGEISDPRSLTEKRIEDLDLQMTLEELFTSKQIELINKKMEGFSLKEISKQLGISYYSLRDRLGLIKKKIKSRDYKI